MNVYWVRCVFGVLEHGFEELHRMNMNEMKSIINCSLFFDWVKSPASIHTSFPHCNRNRKLKGCSNLRSIEWMSIFLLIFHHPSTRNRNSEIEMYFLRWIVSISIANELDRKKPQYIYIYKIEANVNRCSREVVRFIYKVSATSDDSSKISSRIEPSKIPKSVTWFS